MAEGSTTDEGKGGQRELHQIRVHGVAGTLARQILRTDPEPSLSQRHTKTSWFSAKRKPIADPYDRLDAYSWTDLTSGSRGQGVRALLAPLLFVNVAGWMLPHSTNRSVDALSRACVRVAGLATTGFITIGLIWALYLAPVSACRAVQEPDRMGGLSPVQCRFTPWPDRMPEWLVVAIVSVALASWPLVRRWRRRKLAPLTSTADGDVMAAGFDWVGRVQMVESERNTTLLGAVHLVFALLIIGTSFAVSRGFTADEFTDANPLIVVLVVGLLLCAIATSWIEPGSGRTDDAGQPSIRGRVLATGVLSLCLAVATFLGAPIYAGRPSRRSDVEIALVQHFNLVNLIASYAVICLVVLVALAVSSQWRTRLRSLALLGLSMLLAGAMAAGLAFAAVLALDLTSLRREVGGNPHLAYALVVTLAVFLIIALAMLWSERSHLNEDKRPALAQLVRRRLDGLVWALIVAQLAGWAVGLFSVERLGIQLFEEGVTWSILVVLCLVIIFEAIGFAVAARATNLAGLLVVAGAATGAAGFWWFVPDSIETLEQRIEFVGLILPVVLFGFLVYRWAVNVDSRRGLGAAADIATFWPRSFHPFVPRPYSGLAIQELAAELRSRMYGESVDVVLAGHSQGSVLSVLAILQLEPPSVDDSARISLLTYGSPIGHLYKVGFPATFGDLGPLVRCTALRSTAWVNLERSTDPIAAPISPVKLSEGSSPENRNVDEPCDDTDGHSRYEVTKEFRAVESDLAAVTTRGG